MKPALLLKLKFVIGVALMALAGVLMLAYTLYQEKAQKEAEVYANVANYARLLDQSISGSAAKIDLSLHGIADQLQQILHSQKHLNGDAVNALLARRKEWLAGAVEFRVTDADGLVRYGPGVQVNNLASYADRPFFSQLRADDEAQMLVSKPVLGKVSKVWVVVYARRYNYPDGSFAGVIAAAVPVSTLTALLRDLDLGPSGVALLRDQDGSLLTRYPPADGPAAQIGAKIYSKELAALMTSGKDSGLYHTQNTGDNAERVVSYRRLQLVPYHLVVGMGPDDYLADWRIHVRNATALALGALAIVVFFVWGLWRAFDASERARADSDDALRARDQALESLKNQSNLLAELVESLPYGLVVYDEQRVKKFANTQFGAILKVPQTLHEKVSFTFLDFVHFCHDRGDYTDGEPVGQRYARLVRAMDERRLLRGERRQADGAYIEFRAIPISNGWTAITYLDNTESHLQQERLNETQARAQLATESAGIGIWELNLRNNTLLWDAQQYRLHGMEPGSGSNDFSMWVQRVHPQDLAGVQAIFDSALENQTDFIAEFRIVWPDSSIRHIRALGRFSFDAERKPTRIVGTNRDITDTVLTANSLIEARDKAEQASVSKSFFLANMSHEIRTPMNAILGLLQLLSGTPLTPGQADYVEKISGSAKSLLGLLNDILDFSKIEADKLDLVAEPFDVDHLFRDVGVVLAAYVGTKPLDLVFDIDPDIPPYLVGDALRLRQILVNLAGNAVKFTSQGQVVVRVQCTQPVAATVQLAFSIEDSGIGIAPENLHLLFNSFTQAESTTTRRFGGTGLGLAICKKLVDLMGGTIAVSSEPGVGSCFVFHITLAIAAPAQGTAAQAPARPDQQLLLVDDNPLACEATVHMMAALGWQITTAHSCDEALVQIQRREDANGHFDAILIDSQLRPVDGWETAKRMAAFGLRAVANAKYVMVGVNGRDRLDLRTAQEQERIGQLIARPFTARGLQAALAHQPALAPAPASSALANPGLVTARALEGIRILVVDDNAINQQVAEELLTQQGAVVSIASDGRQGVNAIASAKTQYDVVLMDVQMPVMDGYEAVRTIRKQLRLARLPVIGLTANAMASDRALCLEAGMNDHLSKPFELRNLIRVVQHWATGTPRGDMASDVHVDAQTALARMGGLVGVYVRALTGLGKQLPELCPDLQRAIDAGNVHDAKVLLHTFKGTTATVGLTALSTHLAALEARLNGPADLECLRGELPHLATLEVQGQALIQKIVAYLFENDTHGNPDPTEATPVAAMLQQLEAMLQAEDYEALNYFSASRALLHHVPEAQLQTLELALQALDFAAARAACAALRQAGF